MDEYKFASVEMIDPISDDKRKELAQYYLDNNLNPDNDYLSKYLNLPSLPIFTSKVKNTSESISLPKLNLEKIEKPVPVWQQEAPVTVSSDSTKMGKKIIDYFVNKGLSKEQAAGLAGNFHAESGFNPTIVGDNGAAFGLAQWRDGRLDQLKSFAKNNKLDPNNINTQLNFAWHELNTSENAALKKLLKTKTVAEASEVVLADFERANKKNRIRDKAIREKKSLDFYKS